MQLYGYVSDFIILNNKAALYKVLETQSMLTTYSETNLELSVRPERREGGATPPSRSRSVRMQDLCWPLRPWLSNVAPLTERRGV